MIEAGLIPGEFFYEGTSLILYQGRDKATVTITNGTPYDIFIGSHYHLLEANRLLEFEREKTNATHLNMPAGNLLYLPPGTRLEVSCVSIGGRKDTRDE